MKNFKAGILVLLNLLMLLTTALTATASTKKSFADTIAEKNPPLVASNFSDLAIYSLPDGAHGHPLAGS